MTAFLLQHWPAALAACIGLLVLGVVLDERRRRRNIERKLKERADREVVAKLVRRRGSR